MSEAARRAVRLHSKATGGDLACLLELAGFCDERHDAFVCWPSQRTLANFLHVNERTVRDYIAHLKAMGEVTAIPRGRRNYYTLRLPEASGEEYRELLAPNRVNRPSIDDTGSPDPEYIGSPDPTLGDTGSPDPEYTGSPDPEYIGSITHQYRVNRPSHMKGSEREYEREYEREVFPSPILESTARQPNAEEEQTPPPSPPPQPGMEVRALWVGIQRLMADEFSEAQQDSWLKRIVPGWSSPGILCLRVPGTFKADMIRSRYSAGIQAAAWKITGKNVIVEVKPI